MGIFDEIKKGVKKTVGTVKKVVSGVAKGVKKAVKGVAKVVREVGRGVKKLTKNKYVRMGLMIAAAVTLPMFVPAIAALPAVAAGAVTGAITGGAGALLQGGDFKDVLKGAAFGSATGAAFAKIGEAIKTARGATDFKADTVGGKLDAMGADVPDIPVTDAAPTIDVSGDVVSRTVPQPDFQFDPTEVSKFSIDPNINPLDSVSPTGLTNTTNVATEVITPTGNSISFDSATGLWSDKTGVTFTQAQVDLGASKGVLAIKEGAPAYSVTKPIVDTSIAAPPATVKDAIQMSQNFAKYGSTDPTLGQKIAGGFKDAGERLKEAFSPENVVDKTLEVGETLLVGAAQGAISERMADDQYVGDPAYAQQEYANQLQQFQIAYQNAGININDAYANMTYGSGDINAMGNELFRQDTIRIV